MESPNKLKNIKNFPESGVVEIKEVSVGSSLGWEAAVLPDDKSNKA